MKIKFGPSGLGPVKEAVENLEEYARLGLSACEIAFTYGVYIKDEGDAKDIGKRAKELGIDLSIHAPYWINLNSKEKIKVEKSKERILKSCEIGELMGVKKVVFHAGFYAGLDEEETYENIRDEIIEIMKEIKKKKWNVELAPETMGKINVFGSVEQISRLVKDTGCSFCIDFAHILARDKKVDYGKVERLFPSKDWHCHFSGIVYGDKGEKHHVLTEREGWRGLLSGLPKDREITIINESPDPVGDAVKGLELNKK